jgi:hypothetical protein
MRSLLLRSMCTALLLFGLALGARAQTKISGTMECTAPDPMHSVPVIGMKNHSLIVAQSKCTWTKPIEVAGLAAQTAVDTSTEEIEASTGHTRGYNVSTMSNGDLLRVCYFGTATLKPGAPEVDRGRWTFLPSTGKLRGIRGRGTYECRQSGNSMTCDIVGEYAASTSKRSASGARPKPAN